MDLHPVRVLCDLVALPSVNPAGRSEKASPYGESQVTEYLAGLFQELGLPVHRQIVAPGRENILAELAGAAPAAGGRLLLFDAHQDTVSADGMTIDPWRPVIRNGRLYGRGSCDVKGGMAAMLAVLARLARERPAGMPTIIMACSAEEEYTLSGAAALAELWKGGGCPLLPRVPDAAIVAEPTSLNVIAAHRGVIRWRCLTQGRAAHLSQPGAGCNAIYSMARVVSAIERYDREVLAGLTAHPLCGANTLNVGTIAGGTCANIVPERCGIEVELRVPPGEDAESRRKELLDYLQRELDQQPPAHHEPPYMHAPPLPDAGNGELAEQLAAAARAVVGDCQVGGASYATNAAIYARAGVPAVVFGPGSIEQAHTADEWISIDQLHQAVEVLYHFVTRFRHD